MQALLESHHILHISRIRFKELKSENSFQWKWHGIRDRYESSSRISIDDYEAPGHHFTKGSKENAEYFGKIINGTWGISISEIAGYLIFPEANLIEIFASPVLLWEELEILAAVVRT